MPQTKFMKKKVRHHHTKPVKSVAKRAAGKDDKYLVVVRGWMFFVLVALMMGLGLVIGNYLNQSLNGPAVAGVQTEAY